MTKPMSYKYAGAVEKSLSWKVNHVFQSGSYLAQGEDGQWNKVEKQMTAFLEAEHDPSMRCGLNGTQTVFNRDFNGVPGKGETLVLTMQSSPRDTKDVSRITNAVTALFFGVDDEAVVSKIARIAPKAPQPA